MLDLSLTLATAIYRLSADKPSEGRHGQSVKADKPSNIVEGVSHLAIPDIRRQANQ